MEHVLSYQRRVHATKTSFLKRNVMTPLGIVKDWWDRIQRLKYDTSPTILGNR